MPKAAWIFKFQLAVGSSSRWLNLKDEDGDVWILTGEGGHVGPHWDVQTPRFLERIRWREAALGIMKNIQVIDGATNCTYSIFETSDDEFDLIFPDGSDAEFADDLAARIGEKIATKVTSKLWKWPVDKAAVVGIHGTLFYELKFKKKYYPTKRESEMVNVR